MMSLGLIRDPVWEAYLLYLGTTYFISLFVLGNASTL